MMDVAFASLRRCVPKRWGGITCDVSYIFVVPICMEFMMLSVVLSVFGIIPDSTYWFFWVFVVVHEVHACVGKAFDWELKYLCGYMVY